MTAVFVLSDVSIEVELQRMRYEIDQSNANLDRVKQFLTSCTPDQLNFVVTPGLLELLRDILRSCAEKP